ncbi:hypothetical protein [Agarilytica rhodophyticola]|uniref:hypothetical protein n=1 Tax=Agarilytica rhodophyticola TaxID=1737490 RepID=UPI000B347BD6|nr:hypothetical protein [Agarilytica rhodophyticola]
MAESRLDLVKKVIATIDPACHRHFNEYKSYFTDKDLKDICESKQYNDINMYKVQAKAALRSNIGAKAIKTGYIGSMDNWQTEAQNILTKKIKTVLESLDIDTLNAIADGRIDVPSIAKEI